MKKVIVLVSILIVGCAKEEVKKEPVKDCNCDRIVSLQRADMVYVGGVLHTAYAVTVNDCSNWQKNQSYQSEYNRFDKKIGDCW